jgi:thymidylate synthase
MIDQMPNLALGGLAFDSVEDIQIHVLDSIMNRGRGVSPRGLDSLEIEAVTFTLSNPRNRCITNPARRWSLPLAIGEFCWHTSASRSAEFLAYYAPRWREFSDDRRNIAGSCYGSRIFGMGPSGTSQWQRLKQLLIADPDTRRGVLTLRGGSDDLNPDSLDVPCASTLQFLLREEKLDLIVCMRSNDAIWGMPYDVFVFTMLQELLAAELGTSIGRYHHMVGSLHLYRRHESLAKRILAHGPGVTFSMPPMVAAEQLPAFLDQEAAIRNRRADSNARLCGLAPYWINLLEVLRWFRDKRAAQPQIDGFDPTLANPFNSILQLAN